MVALPRHGSGGIITSCYGTVTDDGGNGNYTDTCNGYITIAPGWSTAVSLYFESFHYEPVFDYIKIYDGPGLGFPLIGQYSGTELEGQTITASGPYITIQQVTDDIVSESGFKAIWNCVLAQDEITTDDYRLFPNPAKDDIMVHTATQPGAAALLDLNGRLLWSGALPVGETRINLRHLPAGIYLLRIIREEDGQRLIRKIVKQ